MDLHTATLKDLQEHLLITPMLTQHDTQAILLNLCQRLARQETQNAKQDTAIDGATHSLGQLWQRKKRSQRYAAMHQTRKIGA
jgi:hypothetical protein